LNARDKIESDLVRLEKDTQKIDDISLSESSEDKSKQLNNYLKSISAHPQTSAFLQDLANRNLTWLIPRVAAKYVELMKRANKIVEGEIVTPEALSNSDLQEYRKHLTQRFLEPGSDLRLVNKVDPELLEGVRVNIEGQTFDNSLQTRARDAENIVLAKVQSINNSVEKTLAEFHNSFGTF